MNKLLILFVFSIAFSLPGMSQDSTYESYTGKYNFPEGSAVPYVDIKLINGVLISESPAGTATLQRIDKDTFSIVEYNGVAAFIRNAEGKVIAVKVSVMGLEMEGSREAPNFKFSGGLKQGPVRLLR